MHLTLQLELSFSPYGVHIKLRPIRKPSLPPPVYETEGVDAEDEQERKTA